MQYYCNDLPFKKGLFFALFRLFLDSKKEGYFYTVSRLEAQGVWGFWEVVFSTSEPPCYMGVQK